MARKWTTSYVPLDDLSFSPRSTRDTPQSSRARHLDRVASDDRYLTDDRSPGINRRLAPRRARYASETPLQEDAFNSKPLPSPSHLPGRLSLSAAHATHGTRRWVRAWRPKWMLLGGWRQTVMGGAAVAIGVMFINVIILIWGWTRQVDPYTGQRLVAHGDCNLMQNISTYWHFAINVFSTLLLATSNAAMQCLSAPTREAVDRAHAEGTWVDIGISGFRNWRFMDRWRKWCWILLVASTVPLHLIYNSAIFATTSANEYWAIAVAPEFLSGASFAVPNQTDLVLYTEKIVPSMAVLSKLSALAANGSLQRLENSECISNYSQTMLNRYSNVLLVATSANSSAGKENSSVLRYYHHYPAPHVGYGSSVYGANWICGQDDGQRNGCDFAYFLRHADSWNLTAKVELYPNGSYVGEYNPNTVVWAPPIYVDHCLAQPTQPVCTVELIPEIMIVVLVANAVKILCFMATIRTTSFKPLVTLGDSLASFMARPDPYTRHLGPLSAEQIRQALKRARDRDAARKIRQRKSRAVASSGADDDSEQGETRPDPIPGLPLELGPWKPTRRRWFSGVSRLRWGLTYMLTGTLWLGLCITFIVFVATDSQQYGDLASQWATGFGNVSPSFLAQGTAEAGLIWNSILANTPQIALSLAYMSLNGLWTCILLSREFTLFAKRRTGLRVTEPMGRYQRSTYWLSLPYQFSIPLLGLSWALHWAMSQTLFVAEVTVFDPFGVQDPSYSVSCLGYSFLAMMLLVIIGGMAFAAPPLSGWTRYYSGAPLVESYSLAISAACHPPLGTSDQDLQLLKYGVVEVEEENGEEETKAMAVVDEPRDMNRPNHRPNESQGDAMAPLLASSERLLSPPATTLHRVETSYRDGSLSLSPSPLCSPSLGSLPPSISTLRPRNTLIATLSSTPATPLLAPHTYTPLRALTPAELATFSPKSPSHPKTHRILRWLLPTGGFLKLCAVIVSIIMGEFSYNSEFYFPSDPMLAVYTVDALSLLHITIRFIMHWVRFRRKSALLRSWWWHVVPEFILALAWLGILITACYSAALPVGPGLDSYTYFSAPLLAASAALTVLFGLCGAAEFWMWWQINPGVVRAVIADLRHGRLRRPLRSNG